MSSILVVGSIALDSVKTPEGESQEALGGSAVYFSLSARQFCPVSVVGVVGKDFPQDFRRLLESRGIDLSGFKQMPGKTFRWVGKFGKDLSDAKTLATHLNVFKDFRPELSPMHSRAPVAFLANIDPELQGEVLAQMKSPSVVACDTMNYWISSKPAALKELLSKVQIFFSNEDEAKKLTRQPNPFRAANAIAEWGPSVVVIKKGEHGAIMRAGRRFYVFPAFPLDTVKDPTGAGDTFAGGFMGYVASCGDHGQVDHLKRAMVYGTVIASFTVEDFSTRRVEDLDRSEIESRCEDYLDRLTVARAVETIAA
ncbi:MAG: sugar kinase [Elusimicrobia bacterium]|nr:sugar kinase [Elusimicrobiota bacterium]